MPETNRTRALIHFGPEFLEASNAMLTVQAAGSSKANGPAAGAHPRMGRFEAQTDPYQGTAIGYGPMASPYSSAE